MIDMESSPSAECLHLDWQELNKLMEFGFEAMEGGECGIKSSVSSSSTSGRLLEMS